MDRPFAMLSLWLLTPSTGEGAKIPVPPTAGNLSLESCQNASVGPSPGEIQQRPWATGLELAFRPH